MEKYYIGMDIGGTKCAVLAGTKDVQVLERIEIPTDHTMLPEDYIMERLVPLCCSLIEKYKERGTFQAMGISCGGPLDDRRGIIMSPPNLPGWDEVHIAKMLEEAVGLPVYLQNDANACAIAEWKFGAGIGSRNMIFMTFGTGMGAGLILDGRLYSGTNGMAGEAGHIRLAEQGPEGYGKAGSFEGFCSGGGIKNLCRLMAKERFQGEGICILGKEYSPEEVTAKLVFHAAREGDTFSVEVVQECARYLGRGLAVLVDILNPEKIVLGSIFVRGEDLLRETMEACLRTEVLPASGSVCEVVPASLGEAIGDVAALSVAIVNGGRKDEQETKLY